MSRNIRNSKRPLAVLVATAISAASLSAQAFDVPVHIRITRDQLAPLRADIDGRNQGFSEQALEQIAGANEDVDSIATRSAALFKPERHFTNEQYLASSQRLMTLREQIVALVTADKRDGKQARERLGQALHTLQDFYGHSNWVERGNTPPATRRAVAAAARCSSASRTIVPTPLRSTAVHASTRPCRRR